MPVGASLSAAQKSCIESWIASLPIVDAGKDADDECERCGGGSCVDLKTDPNHCGSCDTVCPESACVGGVCGCAASLASCGGTCVDTQSSTSNCGSCGNVCALGQTCASGVCTCGLATVSFSAAVQPIFTTSCAFAGCHTGPNPPDGLNLSAGVSYSKLVNVLTGECSDGRKRVLPGQPSVSYLMDKLMGVDLCFGTQMPKIGMLPSSQIQTISNWICEGAPNN